MKPNIIKKSKINIGLGNNLLKNLNAMLIKENKIYKKEIDKLENKLEKDKLSIKEIDNINIKIMELRQKIEGNYISPFLKAVCMDLKNDGINNYIAFHLNAYKYPIRYLFKRIDFLILIIIIFVNGFLTGLIF